MNKWTISETKNHWISEFFSSNDAILFLSWLYHEATVHDTDADEDGFITATVIMDEATNNKFEKKFGRILSEK